MSAMDIGLVFAVQIILPHLAQGEVRPEYLYKVGRCLDVKTSWRYRPRKQLVMIYKLFI